MKTVQHDMTSGSPMKMILSFTFPIFIGNVFQQFYNMADAVIVGKFVGTKALAAVGSTGTIMFLIYGFVVGMTAGFTVLTAQKFGAGDMRAMRQTVAGASILSLIVGVILTAAFMILMKPWLMAMNTPEDIFADAYAYIMIVSAGILAQMLYNLLASVLRALGNSKVPLYFLILSALLNIVLDLVLIIVFHMGAAGAAVATVVSQGVSGLLCLVYIVKCVSVLRMSRDDWRPSGHLLKTQMRIGIPMALQYFHHGHRHDDGPVFSQYTGLHAGCGLYGGRQDRTGGIPGLCCAGDHACHIQRPEYRRRGCTAYPPGIPGDHMDRRHLFICGGGPGDDGGKIYDVSFCVGRCGTDHGFRGSLSEMCGKPVYPSGDR